jgi:hypothetical protein
MTAYLSDAEVPELANLTKAQRKIVFRGAFDMLRQEHPAACWLIGLPGGISAALGSTIGWLAAYTLPELSNYRLIVLFGFALILGCLGGAIGGQLHVRRMRPYYRRFIEQHMDEISRIA